MVIHVYFFCQWINQMECPRCQVLNPAISAGHLVDGCKIHHQFGWFEDAKHLWIMGCFASTNWCRILQPSTVCQIEGFFLSEHILWHLRMSEAMSESCVYCVFRRGPLGDIIVWGSTKNWPWMEETCWFNRVSATLIIKSYENGGTLRMYTYIGDS